MAGFEGLYYLKGVIRVLRTGTTDAQGRDFHSLTIPNKPGLVGRNVHLQIVAGGPDAAFSDLLTLLFR